VPCRGSCRGAPLPYVTGGSTKDDRPGPGVGEAGESPGFEPGFPSIPKAAAIPAEALATAANAPANTPADALEGRGDAGALGAPTSLLSLPPPVAHFGRYQLLGRMAVGGMAEIFLGQQEIDGDAARYVIVKLIRGGLAEDPDFGDMFAIEGRVAMALVHPNICHVYEFAREHGLYFIAMEYVDGVTLRKLTATMARQGQRLPVALSVKIIADVAAALDYAHRAKDARGRDRGVVHRDVSPQNIMVSYDGNVKLLDFGISKVMGEVGVHEEGRMKGKGGYMAPEQIRAAPIDGRADVFSLGVCLYEAVTGARLYKRENRFASLEAILEEPPPSILELVPECSKELAAIVDQALQKEPEARYASAGAFQQALSRYLADRREVASSRQLRELMETHFGVRAGVGELLDRSPAALTRLAGFSALGPPGGRRAGLSEPTMVLPEPSRFSAPVVGLAIVLLAGVVGAGVFATRGSNSEASTPTVAVPPVAALAAESASVDSEDAGEPALPPAAAEAPTETVDQGRPATGPSLDEDGEQVHRRRSTRRRHQRSIGFVRNPGF